MRQVKLMKYTIERKHTITERIEIEIEPSVCGDDSGGAMDQAYEALDTDWYITNENMTDYEIVEYSWDD